MMVDDVASQDCSGEGSFRSGFVSFVGRPNAGKSTLLNRVMGKKVSIVSDKPQTTRTQIRGVLSTGNTQIVFVDTPGIHKPRTALGSNLNTTAVRATKSVDAVCFLVDASAAYGRGDEFIARTLPVDSVVVITKIDRASHAQVFRQLAATSKLQAQAWFPVSGRTGEGVEALLDHLRGRLSKGPLYFGADTITDVSERFWAAEVVREQLLRVTRQELPHSIATRVTEWDWPRVRVEILVERNSQKAIVIGTRGEVLKRVGIAARRQLREGVFLELFVRVERNWQNRPDVIADLGY